MKTKAGLLLESLVSYDKKNVETFLRYIENHPIKMRVMAELNEVEFEKVLPLMEALQLDRTYGTTFFVAGSESNSVEDEQTFSHLPKPLVSPTSIYVLEHNGSMYAISAISLAKRLLT